MVKHDASLADAEGWVALSPRGHYVPIKDINIIMTYRGRAALKFRRVFKKANRLLDWTSGRKTKSLVLVMRSGYLIESRYTAEELLNKMERWFRMIKTTT